MKTIELLVRFTIQVEDNQLPWDIQGLFLDLPLKECKLRSDENYNKGQLSQDIPAIFNEFETMDVVDISVDNEEELE